MWNPFRRGENDENTVGVEVIGKKEVKHAGELLRKYKSGKANLEKKIVSNEQFWKLRQWEEFREGNGDDLCPASAWLWNCIVSKHADFIDGFPSPNIRPRMADDKEEAQRLSSVMPIILEQCDFRRIYDDVTYYKLKQGTGVYGVFWDDKKHNGLGDITIRKIDLLELYWEPGITDIQDSANVFLVKLCDNDVLQRQYSQLRDKVPGEAVTMAKYIYDDSIDTSDKSPVVDWYYKKTDGEGRTVLHYCKFVGDIVLYASENDTEAARAGVSEMDTVGKSVAEKGWYAHGKYPFVIDTLFNVEGTIAGYGYTDIGKDAQRQIDLMNQAILKNTLCGAKPRYFIDTSGGVNEKEYADWKNDFIHVEGGIGQDSILPVDYKPLDGNYLAYLQNKIDELKEVAGNRDVNNGGTASGITAASAIAAMQEAGSKQSRDGISHTYNAYKEIVYLCIELMRERYDLPRYFRILGEMGEEQFVSYNNSGLRPRYQGNDFGVDMGYRIPEFDIEVTAEKSSPYKKMEQNELAIQLYGLGVFAPNNADQALMLLETMDFSGKEEIAARVAQNGTIYDQLVQYQQIALELASRYEPNTAGMIAAQINGETTPIMGGQQVASTEDSRMERVRDEAQERTQPN